MKSKGTEGTSLTKVREVILFGRFLRASVVAMAVFALAFVLVPYVTASANATNTVATGVTWEAVSLTLDPDYGSSDISSTRGDVLFGDITPTSKNTTSGSYGTQRVIKKTIGVETPGKYYSVYLSMAGDENTLKMSGSTLTIDPIDATWSSPSAFSSSSWGFAVPTTQTGDYTTPFTGDYTAYDSVLGRDLTVNGTGSTAYNTATWAAVPIDGYAQQIWKATTTNNDGFGTRTVNEQTVTGDTTKDHFSVYYSVMVDTDKMAGTYENTVVYTALASSVTLDSVSKNLSRSVEYVKEGTTETLSFDLSASTATVPRSKVHVYLVPHVLAEHNDFESIDNFSSYAVSANECTTSSDSDFVLTSTGATITCTMPASPNGVDDGVTAEGTISVEEDDGNGGTTTTTLNLQKGEFDFWVKIDDYGYNYISKYTRSTTVVPSVVYAGLQSKDANNSLYFTKMQEMTSTVCANTNQWGNTTTYVATGNEGSDSTAGSLTGTVTLYNPSGTALDSASILTTGLKDDIGTFELTDNRDSKTYLVRKLADGNCWMVQNLDLDLAAVAAGDVTLTNTNTDIDYTRTSGRTGWDPMASSVEKYTTTYADELTAAGLDKNLSGLTNYLLGTTQTTLFQSGSQTGNSWHWGSKLNESGEKLYDSSDTDVSNPLVYTRNRTDSRTDTGTETQTPRNRSAVSGNTIYAWLDQTYAINVMIGNNTTATSQSGTLRYIENNSRAEMPRSYDTGSNWINNMSTSNADGAGGNNQTSGTPNSPSEYVGDYYNWYAATAESGTWDMSTDSVAGSATDSICPYGWQLPNNSGTKSWYNLITTNYSANSGRLGARKLRSFPLSVIMSGYYAWVNGYLGSRGTGGYYWSSTPYAVTHSHHLYFYSTSVYPQYGSNKTYGLTVRCVAR